MAADSSLRAGSSNASSMTLADLLTAPGSGRPAVVLPESELAVSRAKLASEIARLSDVLALGGVEPQTPVSIVLVNGLEFIVSFLALCNARAVAAPLNPAYKADEFKFYMEDAEARAVILPPGPHPARDAATELNLPIWEASLDPSGSVRLERVSQGNGKSSGAAAGPPRPEDVALFLHTSGTTSRPKGVPLTHANLMASIRNIAETYQPHARGCQPDRDAAVSRAWADRRDVVDACTPAARP